jgi:hypothetical protein
MGEGEGAQASTWKLIDSRNVAMCPYIDVSQLFKSRDPQEEASCAMQVRVRVIN